MKENRYFKGQDIRAVENPYEAAFELADNVKDFSKSALLKIKILIGIFIYYSVVILGVIGFNILFGKVFSLIIFSIIFSIFMLIIALIAEKLLITSHIFFQDIRSHHNLMLKIERVTKGDFNLFKLKKKPTIKGNPMKSLMDLISITSDYSKKISKTFKVVTGFIGLWYLAGILYLSIQFFRFGPDSNEWEIDWLLPGGIDLIIAVLATVLILILNDQFNFVFKRYSSIEYALAQKPVNIPKSKNPISRYMEYLSKQYNLNNLQKQEYTDKNTYFDGEFDTKKGMIFVKYLKENPKSGDLQRFKERVIQQCGHRSLYLAVLIYQETFTEPISDDVYMFVIENPIRIGRQICNIQLVIEGEDGKYDFIPIISF